MPAHPYRRAVGRREDEASVVMGDRDRLPVDHGVMVPAQKDGVRESRAPGGLPRQGVVDLSVGDRVVAPWISACPVSGDHGPPLGGGEKAFVSSDVENLPACRENDARKRRIAQEPGQLTGRQGRSVV